MIDENISVETLMIYPALDENKLDMELNAAIESDKHKIVVLDDDPTGVQTVHDLSVYTDWSVQSIKCGFAEKEKAFYVLTNSRGLSVEQTVNVHTEIAKNVEAVSRETGIDYIIINRSDSTLRGYYPLETEVLKREIEACSNKKFDGEILCPFFKEGGRFTLDNVHYVQYGKMLKPAGKTEFAKDQTFGYKSSNLCNYIEEKTSGKFKAKDVISISLHDLRTGNVDVIRKKLIAVDGFNKIVVNAIDYCDLKVFMTALYQALADGKRFLYRTAASIVKVAAGIDDQPLLSRRKMITKETKNGGIIVVGSHTKKTTEQLDNLLTLSNTVGIEFNSNLVLDSDKFQKEINRVVTLNEEVIESGKTAVNYTKRKLLSVKNDSPEQELMRSVKISDGVQSLVGLLKVTPRFVVAKGGITSSDVGTKALKVKKARVLGQIQPGIPVWKTGSESKFPGIPYVIFPGNVGESDTLKNVVSILIEAE